MAGERKHYKDFSVFLHECIAIVKNITVMLTTQVILALSKHSGISSCLQTSMQGCLSMLSSKTAKDSHLQRLKKTEAESKSFEAED